MAVEAACPVTCGSCDMHKATSGYSKTPETIPAMREYMKRGFQGDGDGHAFGYGTCQWIRGCTEGQESVGSPCSSTQSGVEYKGFCFRSDTGSLECGRMTAIDNEYGEKPIAFDAAAGTSSTTNTPTSVNMGGVLGSAVARDNMMPANEGFAMSGRASTLTTIPSTPGVGAVYRCPTGSPAKTIGQYVSKRMLIAGCMITSDPLYDVTAEVHVPAYCATWTDYKKGCLLPWAVNFDPMAKQSGKCTFATVGCTSPTALNYNSEATVQDTVNDCIEAVTGCTVNHDSYGTKKSTWGQPAIPVKSDTPTYKSLYFGPSKVRQGYYSTLQGYSTGLIPEFFYNGPVTTNFDDTANVNTGCVIAIEGCMDPAAANYDSQATVQTWSWCVPIVKGCMMPSENAAGPSYVNPGPHAMDGLGGNFSIMTTVHDPAFCIIARHGCNVYNTTMFPGFDYVTASNYDPATTVNSICYFPIGGCLNPEALNFGCQSSDAISECNPGYPFYVTRHVKESCKYPWNLSPLPPAPPPPNYPPGFDPNAEGVIVTYSANVAFTVDGDVAFWTDDKRLDMIAAFKAALMMAPASNVTLSIAGGSVETSFEFASTDESATDTVLSSAQDTFTDATALQDTIGAAVGVTVLSIPIITKKVTYTTSELALGITILTLIILGSLCLACCIVGGIITVVRRRKQKNKATYPA